MINSISLKTFVPAILSFDLPKIVGAYALFSFNDMSNWYYFAFLIEMLHILHND